MLKQRFLQVTFKPQNIIDYIAFFLCLTVFGILNAGCPKPLKQHVFFHMLPNPKNTKTNICFVMNRGTPKRSGKSSLSGAH